MITVLKTEIKTTNGFMIVLNGRADRWDEKLEPMLTEYEAVLGKEMWKHIILCVSKWSFDQKYIDEREINNKTPKSWITEHIRKINEKFTIDVDLDYVFIDSWARNPETDNLSDSHQQVMYNNETKKLWNWLSNSQDFDLTSKNSYWVSQKSISYI